MSDQPLAELVAAVDQRLRELGWEQPWLHALCVWRHPTYGIWSHESAVDLALQVEAAVAPRLELAAEPNAEADALELERVYGPIKRPPL